MKSFDYVIRDEVGIHARPAGMLVKTAKETGSKVTVECGGKSAEADKLFSVMGLGAKQGSVVTVKVHGGDEDNALSSMKQFFENNL